MPQNTYESIINFGAPWQTTAGTALTTATTATISPQTTGNDDFPIPLNYFYNSSVIKVTARGYITTTTTSTTATFLLAANQGGTYTTLATTAAVTTGTTAYTGLQWRLKATVKCTNVGSSGSLYTQGELLIRVNTTAPAIGTANTVMVPLPDNTGDNQATVNTLLSTAIVLRATLAGANATIRCNNMLLEAVN